MDKAGNSIPIRQALQTHNTHYKLNKLEIRFHDNSLGFSSRFPKEKDGIVFLVASAPLFPMQLGSLYLPGPGPRKEKEGKCIVRSLAVRKSDVILPHLFRAQQLEDASAFGSFPCFSKVKKDDCKDCIRL